MYTEGVVSQGKIDGFSESQSDTQSYAAQIVNTNLSKVLLVDISGPKKSLKWLSKNSGTLIKYAIFATFGLMGLFGFALLIISLSKKITVAKTATLKSVGVSVLIVSIIVIGIAIGMMPIIEPHEGATLL